MNDVFILGHGLSLLDLTEEEKDYIKSCPSFTTSIYLPYYEAIGIVPDYLVLPNPLDDYPARIIVTGGSVLASATVCHKHNLKTQWYTHSQIYDYLVHKKFTKPYWQQDNPRTSKPVHPSIKHLDFDPKFQITQIDCGETVGFHRAWATNINERFLFSSSSATAINLAGILYPNHHIKLIGVDGGKCKCFYHQACLDGFVPSLFSGKLVKHGKERFSGTIHYSTAHLNILSITENLKNHHGCEVSNCNPNSVFVKSDHEFEKNFSQYRNAKHNIKFQYSPILN